MAKSNIAYICTNCAYESTKWLGQCPECQEWSTMETGSRDVAEALKASEDFKLTKLSAVKKRNLERLPTGFEEFDRVLGGGLVTGEVILISGEPGIGKSTLLLQMLERINAKTNAVYISAEESIDQIALRADRVLGAKKGDLDIITGFEVNTILNAVTEHKYKFIIIDSIQTIHSEDARGLPGGLAQMKAVASRLVKYAKQNGVTMVLVGQITKQGTVAGPKLVEHLVDAVIQLEGDEKHGFRILRSLKNRYGSVNEVGLFEMADKGMVEVSDPSYYFKQEGDVSVGVCPASILEGNRVLVMEVQALTVATPFSLPKRVAEGISKSKLELLCAIISKYTRVNLSDKDVYINVAGGLKVKDPALDLAVALAILSSALGKNVPKKLVVSGEVSLTGVIRVGSREEIRSKEVERLGYKTFKSTFGSITTVRKLHQIFK